MKTISKTLIKLIPKSHEDFLTVKATIEKYYDEAQEKDDVEFRYWWWLDNMSIYFRYLRPICNGEFAISLKYHVR